ncbi:MAG: ABC transporter permease [Gemmatimonadota bacterium]|nr:ABC transporter permease [Gemmatimonadota bacterium]
MRELLRRIWYFLRRDRVASDLEEEMRLHVELRAAANQRSGSDAEEALFAARRRFGNFGNIEETSRDAWGFGGLDRVVQDLRYAVRRLRKRPSFSVPVLAVLALGIGAITAVFSAVDAAILRPLPFAEPSELVTLTNVSIPFSLEEGEPFPADLNDVIAMSGVFSQVSGFAAGALNLSDSENPLRVKAGVVTTEFFATLGARPALGRTFAPEEGEPNGPPVVILSNALWQRQFGGGDMLGKSISINGRSHTVVGVMHPEFSFPNDSDLWIPMSVPTTFATFEPFRGFLPSHVVARLAPGVTIESASAQLLARWQQLASTLGSGRPEYVNEMLDEVRDKGAIIALQRELVGDRQRPLLILLGATVLLLLIACANVANLLLSDAALRRREIAVREVLGATRRRIVRQLLAESVLLSLGGAALGIALAPAALGLVRGMLPTNLAGVAPAQLDLRVLAFATGLAIITGVMFGLWPALATTRENAGATIKSGGGPGATAGKVGRTRRMLVVSELALTVMLLVAAGLMLRSFDRLMSQDMGMDPERVATLEMSFARASGGRAERLRTMHAVLDRLNVQPGINAAGAVNDLPLRGGGGISISIDVDGAPTPIDRDEMRFARYLMASGDYFGALGIPLLRGRVFTAADDSLAPPVAIISEKMVSTWWPGVDPVGRTFRLRVDSIPFTIVGIVADVRESGLDRDPTPQMYFPIDGQKPTNVAIVARGTLPEKILLARLREAVSSTDRSQAVYNVRMMNEVLGESVAPRRTSTVLIALFAALALALSVLGVYAVVAYGVAQRSREFGIRSALGATGRDLVGLVSREMAATVAAGIALGLGAAWMLSRLLAALLYGVEARDPATFVVVPIVLIVPAVIATMVPAVRALRTNPADVMRAD